MVQCVWLHVPYPVAHLLRPMLISKPQKSVWIPAHCLVDHFLCLILTRDMVQQSSFFLDYFVAHFLGHKMIRDTFSGGWFCGHCHIARLLRLILIRDIRQEVWFHVHCLVAHISCLKVIRDIVQQQLTTSLHNPAP